MDLADLGGGPSFLKETMLYSLQESLFQRTGEIADKISFLKRVADLTLKY